MAVIRVQHSFQGMSGMPEDQFVNTWYFVGTALDPTTMSAIASAVEGFYMTTPTGQAQAIYKFMSGTSDAALARTKIYNMADALPRTPLLDRTYSPPAAGTGTVNLPNEVAICLSYAAAPAPPIPIARRRGRLYLGPWAATAEEGGGLGVESRPALSLRQIIVAAANDLEGVATGAGWTWSVFSQTNGSAASIVRVWCDDAWDVQRRRGVKPGSRVSLTL